MKKFAVFDIDGTLIRWQLYHALVDKLAKIHAIKPSDYEKLKSERKKWKNREDQESFKKYENTLIEIFESSLPNISTKDFEHAVNDVINEYSDQVYTFTRDLIYDLKNKGYTLIAISGSHQELVHQIAEKFDFDIWIGTKYERINNEFSGTKILGSKNKKHSLQNIVNENNFTYQDSYAIGDSLSDAAMLEIVENPIAFNPDSYLLEVAKKNHWQIVVERKNVIYKLQNRGEEYVLAETN